MSTAALQPAPGATSHSSSRARRPALRRPLTALLLVILAVLLVSWAGTRPGFDPYGWLVWGRQTLAGNLDTNAAPSWKPLPYLLTVPFALFGRAQLPLWMIASVAVSLSGALFGGRIAHRLVLHAAAGRRLAAGAGALLAGLAVLEIDNLSHYVLSAQSDPMIVALCLAAVDLLTSGRPQAALVVATLGGLGRPEVWPYLGLLGGWLWLSRPRARWVVAACGAATLLLWFGIPALSSRSAFVAADNAYGSGRRVLGPVAPGTLSRFAGLLPWPLEVGAALIWIAALVRRQWLLASLGATAALWVVVEVAFALHGWPGLARYMFEPAAVVAVLAGTLLGWLVAAAQAKVPWGRDLSLRARGQGALCAVLALCLLAGVVPAAVSRVQAERRDLAAQRDRTSLLRNLGRTVARLGGAATLRRCGTPVVMLEYQTALAWQLGVNVSRVGFKLGKAIRRGPALSFAPHGVLWHVRGYAERASPCRIGYAPGRSGRSG
jgi:hypothetical protein